MARNLSFWHKMKSQETRASKLKFDPKNARKRTALSANVISNSLKQFGAYRSIVIDENDVVRAGNGTLQEAGELGIDKVLVVETDGDTIVAVRRKGLTEDQWKQYAIADNSASDFSTWDAEVLAELAEEVDLGDFFPQEKLDEVLQELSDRVEEKEEVSEEEEEETPALEEVSIREGVETGSVWRLGNHYIMCGDCTIEANIRELVAIAKVQKIDLMLTDPPYGVKAVKAKSNGKDTIGNGGKLGFGTIGGGHIVPAKTYAKIANDDSTDTTKKVYELGNKIGIKNYILFGGNYFIDFLFPSACWIVWDKENPGNKFADVELAWTSYKGGVILYRWLWNGLCRKGDRSEELISRVHPTQKLVGLFKLILKDFESEQVIFEPFLGSGTTLIACQQMNRTCLGIELSERYIETVISRWEKLTKGVAERVN